jgi:hypothetical protein
VDQLTESPMANVPPNPLDQLSLRQLVVFVARAHQRPLTELAGPAGAQPGDGSSRTALSAPNAVRAGLTGPRGAWAAPGRTRSIAL